MSKVFALIIILILGALSAYHQYNKENSTGIAWSVIGTLVLGILVNYISPPVIALLPDIAPPVSSSNADSKNDPSTVAPDIVDGIPNSDGETQDNNEVGTTPLPVPSTSSTTSTNPVASNDIQTPTSPQSGDDSAETSNTDNYINQLVDITTTNYASGSLTDADQKDCYCYTAFTSGTYRFSTNLSAGGEVRVRISGENNKSIDYGTNALTIDLEAGKTYILSVEYRNGPCDYAVNIGVPLATTDITGSTLVSGSITYQDQKDHYRYTASVSGTYRFSTDLSAGGEVRVRVSGENNKSIDYGTNALTIDLEAGKTYILGIEYRNGPCDYAVNIGIPLATTDITGSTSVSGNITYQDQKDHYHYTALTSGTYRFSTDLSAGGEVRVRISGENSKSINYGTNALTIDLEAGKTYILSVEYRNGPCDYVVNIGVPLEILDITGETFISGKITFQDQKNRYYYTAPVGGTYRFDTNLSASGEVRVRISGENGNSINYGTNALTIDLEAGKTYILSVEYRNGPCNYDISVGVPIPITDFTGYSSISGNITYQDQKDKYYYTAPVSGKYYFNTNLSAGGEVRIRISGENGNSLNYGTNALTIDLEAGKTYILSVEYRNAPCSYTILLELQ